MLRRSIQEGILTMSSSSSSSTSNGTDSSDDSFSPSASTKTFVLTTTLPPPHTTGAYKPLAVLSAHAGSVSSLALCGEFLLSASQGKDIIVWQQPDLKIFAKFGQGDGSVKALASAGSRVFTAHQDSRIRVWRASRSSENAFRLVDTLPTTKDYLGKFMKQSNYVQTRRNHKRLWIEHADSISCLAVHAGIIYSGSWDKTLKVWRLSDLKCLESIKAHDDAINGLVAGEGRVYSASADGKIKIWGKEKGKKSEDSLSSSASSWSHVLKATLEGRAGVSVNSVVVSSEGKWVYGGGSDGFVMGWEKSEKGGDFEEWRLGFEVRGHKMAVLCMCVVGEMVCSGSADKRIGLWKREESGRLCKFGVIHGHEGPVKCLQASSPSNVGAGFLLYSGSLDKSIRVWWVSKQDNVEEEKKRTSFKTLLMQHV